MSKATDELRAELNAMLRKVIELGEGHARYKIMCQEAGLAHRERIKAIAREIAKANLKDKS